MEYYRKLTNWDVWPYMVSDAGNVRGIGSRVVLKTHTHKKTGYPTVTLRHGGGNRKTFRVHSLVAAVFIGPRPVGHQVNHMDGIKSNNAASNLEYVTPKQNKAHAKVHGLLAKRENTFAFKHPEAVRGSNNPFAKLTEADIVVIRREWNARRANQPELARRFKTTQANISDIVLRKRWQHVTER